jgi:hypothetical protein
VTGLENAWQLKGRSTERLFGRQGQSLEDLIAEINADNAAEN